MAENAVRARPEGSYQRWLTVGFLGILPFAVVVLVMVAQYRGVTTQIAVEQAVVARRLARGEGFTTGIILPRSLAFNHDLQHHPELRHGPLSVLPAAILVKLIGENEGRSLAFSSMFAWLLSVWLLFLVGRVLFNARAGLLAALLMTFSPAALGFGISADGRAWAMPLLLALWLALCTMPPSRGKAALCGGLMGLCALTFYGLVVPLLFAVIPALWSSPPAEGTVAAGAEGEAAAAAAPPRSKPAFGLAGLAWLVMLVVCLPWMVRNVRVAKTPLPGLTTYAVARYTEAAPGRMIDRKAVDPGASAAKFVRTHKRQLVQKVLTGIYALRSGVTQALDWPLLGLALVALLCPLTGLLARARSALAWAMVWHIFLLSALTQQYGELAVWNPLVALLAGWAVDEQLTRRFTTPQRWLLLPWSPQAARRIVEVALVLLVAVPGLAPQLFGGERATAHPSAPDLKLIGLQTKRGDVVMTDDPWAVAWEVDRPSIWLAQSGDDLAAIEQLSYIKMIYFTMRATSGSSFVADERGEWWSWAMVMRDGYRSFRPVETRMRNERILLNATPPPGGGAAE